MDSNIFAGLLALVFVLLLLTGRAQIVKGANAQVANGSVVLVLATLAGAAVLNFIGAMDVW